MTKGGRGPFLSVTGSLAMQIWTIFDIRGEDGDIGGDRCGLLKGAGSKRVDDIGVRVRRVLVRDAVDVVEVGLRPLVVVVLDVGFRRRVVVADAIVSRVLVIFGFSLVLLEVLAVGDKVVKIGE